MNCVKVKVRMSEHQIRETLNSSPRVLLIQGDGASASADGDAREGRAGSCLKESPRNPKSDNQMVLDNMGYPVIPRGAGQQD